MHKNILILGSGAREHALGWRISKSPHCYNMVSAPGNPGLRTLGQCLDIDISDPRAVVRAATLSKSDMVVVGPELPLAAGVVDHCQTEGIPVFGPSSKAAHLTEISKTACGHQLQAAGISAPRFESFVDPVSARSRLRQNFSLPVVVKADGLAAGKGVYVCDTYEEADEAIYQMLVRESHGKSGLRILLQEYLTGREVSVQAFCDGKSAAIFPPSRDHKRLLDGNRGPNTGGMGAIAPPADIGDSFQDAVSVLIVEPLLKRLQDQGCPFTGVMFPGLMLNDRGMHVLEVNARGGDPETQISMLLLQSDLIEVMQACIDGELAEYPVRWSKQHAACVVLASATYPQSASVGWRIDGLKEASDMTGVNVFHAGTQIGEYGNLQTAGGRVLSVCAVGDCADQARERVYEAVKKIHFHGMQYRTDIGQSAGQ